MPFRRRAAAVLGLLVLAPVLAACGEDAPEIEVGDVVPARQDAQFAEGSESWVALPLGRLEVLLGEATTELDGNETRQLETIEAPAGSTFVPITWQYDSGTFGDYADYLETDATPVIELLADGAKYRLPAPEATGSGSESFYVLVSGSGDDAALAVEFDGVTQTLDLATGEREADRAEPLYELKPRRDRTRSCTTLAKFGRKTTSPPYYECKVTRAARLPYAAGEWAAQGRSWFVVTVETSMGRFDVIAPDVKSGAIYYAGAEKSTFQLGGIKPTKVLEDRERSACPDTVRGGCLSTYHLVFDVGSKAPDRLRIKQDFQMNLSSVWGGAEGENVLKLPVTVNLRLR